VEASQSGVLALAAVFGKPVVTTRVGGIPEIVEPSGMGIVVPPNDPQAFAVAILALAGDGGLRGRMGDAARRLAETTWSHASVAERALQIYGAAREEV
jgi:glycosyltransferase involved in cell wall biosynthesis